MMSLLLLIFSFLYILFLFINYILKQHIDLFENKIYQVLMITNLLGIILEITCILLAAFFKNINPNIIVRIFMTYLFVWGTLITLYIYNYW